ncbi:permease-like cell division protein FtsX [Zhaonella formicivorans]|jgi:cell division transport system permease protein|uniref:permease-like cell division protein FtsX n=1 Tax=Zhaonella formicivorans TaxID=2528593 RepID=UPI0010E6C523|nr:permease-like cell division protein FtsX [Zhaonella formicivorans]
MKIRTVGYFFRQAFTSVRRNVWIGLAAMATVAITLFIVGIFTLLVLNADYIATDLESNVEIVAFMEVDAARDEVLQAEEQIKAIKGVAEVKLVTKEEGLANLNKQFGRDHDLLAALGGVNPLPDLYKIKAQSPEYVQPIAETLEQIAYVDKVDYGQGVVEKLFAVVRWVRLIGSGIVLLLSLGAVFLVSTTIRLTVFARRKEINIMKYVGATDWFIRWPFFIEGMILGFTGALLAVGALYLTYDFLVSNLRYSISFIPIIADTMLIIKILSGLLAAGTLVGALGSMISVRRFLQV